jgi:AraC-like DNA-binding protein
VEVVRHETELGYWEVFRRPFLGGRIEGWTQHTRAPVQLREVPFPGIPMIFNFGPAWEIETDGTGLESRDSFVAGLGTGPALVRGAATSSCIELRLTPLGAHRLLQVPMHELSNRAIELEEVLPGGRELTARLHDADGWAARFDLLETFFVRRIADAEPAPPELAWSWEQLVRSGGRTPIGRIAEELGWSRRRLIGRFREAVGLAPKAAARVIRFDRAASALRAGCAPPLGELAFACGYFDQAHLNRDFREFAGTTPTAFASARLESGGIAA